MSGERMTIARLTAIAEGRTFIPEGKVNVRPNPRHTPLMRELLRVSFLTVGGEPWLYWYWTPEPIGDIGLTDCGYSGRKIGTKKRRARRAA